MIPGVLDRIIAYIRETADKSRDEGAGNRSVAGSSPARGPGRVPGSSTGRATDQPLPPIEFLDETAPAPVTACGGSAASPARSLLGFYRPAEHEVTFISDRVCAHAPVRVWARCTTCHAAAEVFYELGDRAEHVAVGYIANAAGLPHWADGVEPAVARGLS